MSTVKHEYIWRLNVSRPWGDKTPQRRKIANALRRVADRVDRRESIVIEMDSMPPLSSRERDHCIREGMKTAGNLYATAVRHEAAERVVTEVMKRDCRHLLED